MSFGKLYLGLAILGCVALGGYTGQEFFYYTAGVISFLYMFFDYHGG